MGLEAEFRRQFEDDEHKRRRIAMIREAQALGKVVTHEQIDEIFRQEAEAEELRLRQVEETQQRERRIEELQTESAERLATIQDYEKILEKARKKTVKISELQRELSEARATVQRIIEGRNIDVKLAKDANVMQVKNLEAKLAKAEKEADEYFQRWLECSENYWSEVKKIMDAYKRRK